MEITASSPFLCAGENDSKTLTLTVPQELPAEGEIRIAFTTPSGRALLTPPLTVNNGVCEYRVPAEVTDRYGKLYAQAIVTGENGYCLKSDIFSFEVYPGLDEQGAEPENGGLITLAQIDRRLSVIESFLDGLEPISPAELAAILV